MSEVDEKLEGGRLERGVQLDAEMVSDGRYRVTGGDTVHWVDLVSPDNPRCDCGDHLWRDAICKHIIAARLREGDERVLFQIGQLVRALKQSNREKEKKLKKFAAA
jgi:hypothetical protein